jgi:hypothetical protein
MQACTCKWTVHLSTAGKKAEVTPQRRASLHYTINCWDAIHKRYW